MHDGEAELGIVEGAVDNPVLAQWKMGEDRLILVQAKQPRSRANAQTFAKARWVMREQGSGTRSTFDKAMRQMGVDPTTLDVALVLPSNEGVRTAAEAGAGVAALSALVVEPAIVAGTLHVWPFDLGARPFFGLRHKERYRSPAADALVQMIQDENAPGRLTQGLERQA